MLFFHFNILKSEIFYIIAFRYYKSLIYRIKATYFYNFQHYKSSFIIFIIHQREK